MYFRILIVFILFTSVGVSQTFSLYGIISDSYGKPIPGVNVVVTGLNTGDASTVKGQYKISGLTKGEYLIRFSAIGYSELEKKIFIDNDYRLDAVLQTKIIISDQVIVSAGKHVQSLNELPVSASLIENTDLLRYNNSNLRDALKYVPGVNLVDDQLSIRGSSGYSRGAGARVLVAIDGLPFYTGDTGEIIWEAIPVNEVERVEIIKGASSSLYGSTAIGGVINLITKDSNEPFTYIKSYIGAYDKPSHDVWDWSEKYRLFNGQTISHSNNFGNFSFSGSFTRLEDSGYKKNNFNKRYIGYLKSNYRMNEKSSLKLIFNSMNQKSGNFIYWKNSRNALEPPDADIGQTVSSNRYMLGLISENKIDENFSLYLRGSYYQTNWTDETTSGNSSDADQYRGELQGNWNINEYLLVISGFELSKSIVKSNLFGSPESFGAGIYSQGEVSFKFPLSLTAGIRYDYNQVNDMPYSQALSPKLGFNYKFDENFSLRGMLGTGFRSPSLAEKFTSTTVSGIRIKPNPDVKPESNVTFESGILMQTDYFVLDAALFRNEYYDMIEPFIDPRDGQIVFNNLVRARIQGFEINISPRITDQFKLNLNYTFMDPRDLNSDKILKYRPKHLFYSSLTYNLESWDIGINFRFWSKVEEIDNELVDLGFVPDGDKRVPVYVFDFNTGYNFLRLGFPGRVYLNLKNVFNYNYIELIGNIAPLRNIAISFEIFI